MYILAEAKDAYRIGGPFVYLRANTKSRYSGDRGFIIKSAWSEDKILFGRAVAISGWKESALSQEEYDALPSKLLTLKNL